MTGARRRPRDHRRGRYRPTFNRASRRLREIERVLTLRGYVALSNDPERFLLPVAQCFHRIASDKTHSIPTSDDLLDRLEVWAGVRAPFVTREQFKAVIRKAMQRPQMDRADLLARRLALTYADRMALRITTIGACDVDKAARTRERKKRKRLREKARAAAKRAARNAVPRAVYLARSKSQLKPWEAEIPPVSRRTWYRRRKAQPIAAAPVAQVRVWTHNLIQ
jgi:hypothetical protein